MEVKLAPASLQDRRHCHCPLWQLVPLVTLKAHGRSIIFRLTCQKRYLGNCGARIINEICKITYQQLQAIVNHMEKIKPSTALKYGCNAQTER